MRERRHLNLNGSAPAESTPPPFFEDIDEGDDTIEFTPVTDKPTSFTIPIEASHDDDDDAKLTPWNDESSNTYLTRRTRKAMEAKKARMPVEEPIDTYVTLPSPVLAEEIVDDVVEEAPVVEDRKTLPMWLAGLVGGLLLATIGALLFLLGHNSNNDETTPSSSPSIYTQTVTAPAPAPSTITSTTTAPAPSASTTTVTSTTTAPAPSPSTVTSTVTQTGAAPPASTATVTAPAPAPSTVTQTATTTTTATVTAPAASSTTN